MLKYIITVLLCLCILYTNAQTDDAYTTKPRINGYGYKNSYDEITATYGIYSVGYYGADALDYIRVHSLDYTHYLYDGWGIRTGINYLNNVDNNLSMMAFPIKLVYRLKEDKIPLADRMISSAAYALGGDPISSIIALIPIHINFGVGISPGYILNKSPLLRNGDTEIAHRFHLTIDAGIRVYYRVWRIKMLVDAEYHYLVTNNYRRYNDNYRYKKLPHSFFSFTVGLAYMF